MELNELLESGLLELYVIGDLSEAEKKVIEHSLNIYPSLRQELNEIELALESYAELHSRDVDPTSKPLLLASINYSERLENGELPVNPPTLHQNSRISDYQEWLGRDDLQEPKEYESMCGRIIGANEEKTTMIIWLKDGAPPEIHTDEIEKFLIVEGTCEITIGNKIHYLKPGDYLQIPLHIPHSVRVTSEIRCKIILERFAA